MRPSGVADQRLLESGERGCRRETLWPAAADGRFDPVAAEAAAAAGVVAAAAVAWVSAVPTACSSERWLQSRAADVTDSVQGAGGGGARTVFKC